LEFLEWAVLLEHGVEMGDEQHALALARRMPGTLGDEVAGATETAAVDPAGLEAERLELRTQDVRHCAYAGEVHRAAIDVDDLFHRPHRGCLPGLPVSDDLLLRGRGGNQRCRQCEAATGENCCTNLSKNRTREGLHGSPLQSQAA